MQFFIQTPPLHRDDADKLSDMLADADLDPGWSNYDGKRQVDVICSDLDGVAEVLHVFRC